MNTTRRTLVAFAAALSALAAAGTAAAESTYPDKPIRIIVPYPAGGLSDFQVRAVAEPMAKLLGQPIIVDNKPGASAGIGTQLAAAAQPDGYTLVFVNNGFVITPHLNQPVGYDPVKDFAPISFVTTSPMVLVVNRSLPVTDTRQFIDYVKRQPAGIEYGSAGNSSFGHMATAMFSQSTGLNMVHVPYKGEAPMSMALRSNEVKVLITTPSPSIMGAVKEGTLKLLAVASKKPDPLLPGVKLVSETVPGYSAEVWFGLLAPKGTPPQAIAKIHDALAKVLATPDIKAKFATVGATAESNTPAEFRKVVVDEYAMWGDLIKKSGIKGE
jgi:tripartite-type tricarboxylate transporter receptor subunit TctC